MRRLHAVVLAAVLVALVGALWSPSARALDRTFAGSVQLDEHVAPFEPSSSFGQNFFAGFTTEAAGKIAADIGDHVSANVKICYGCHGFEADMAYFDLRVADELNVRVGRFSPSFGGFNLRHDPANHKTADKPLPYDMGRMLRMRDWNQGVLPAPFPDNGVEVNGTHWFGSSVQVDYAAYAVNGFKGGVDGQYATDLNFSASHGWPQTATFYYVDGNNTPAGGGRLAATFKLASTSDLTLGASGMYGTYDPNNRFSYAIFGADAWLRLGRTNVRAEWLARRQEFDTSDPTQFKYAIAATDGNFFVKHGAYVEVEQPVGAGVDAIARVDGLWRVGNVAAGSPLSNDALLLRYTLGGAYVLAPGVRLKVDPELWQFDYADASGRKLEGSLHVGVAGAF